MPLRKGIMEKQGDVFCNVEYIQERQKKGIQWRPKQSRRAAIYPCLDSIINREKNEGEDG